MKIPRICLTLLNLGVVIFLGSFLSCGHSPAVKEGDLFAGMKDDPAPLVDKESEATSDATAPITFNATSQPSTLDSTSASGKESEKTGPGLLDGADKLSSPDPMAAKETNPPVVSLNEPPEPELVNPAAKTTTEMPVMPTLSNEPTFSTPKAENDPLIPNLTNTAPAPTETETQKSEMPKTATKKTSKLPTTKTAQTSAFPTEPVNRGKTTLNRFYFLRDGDKPETISQLLYATTERTKDLTTWNSGTVWKAGKVIYYVSPEQSDDDELLSFYEENGVETEEYVVKAGDWLSKIAKAKYGSVFSWKEIAKANGISSPKQLAKGQKLMLYPTMLVGYSKPAADAPMLASAATPVDKQLPPPAALATERILPAPQAKAQITQADMKADSAMPENLFEEPTPKVKAKDKVAKKDKVKPAPDLASAEVGGFLEQNIFAIIVAAVAFGLIFWLFMLRRKRDAEF